MYPYPLLSFPDGSSVGFYEICMLVGVIAAMVLFSLLAGRRKMPAKMQNLILVGIVVSVVVGYLTAVLFQAVYNALETGEFVIDETTGATFYGGLIGGAACLILIYFVGSRILFGSNAEGVRRFPTLANIAAACVPLAHGFGRIGCLLAGCCHGGETDAWYGIPMDIGVSDGVYVKVVPLQLFEAIFLFALAAFIIARVWKGKGLEAPVYLIGYGIWRFVIEFFRTDDRGASLIPGLSPSQVTAIFMILVGAAIYVGYFVICSRKGRGFFADPAQAAKGGSAAGDPSLKNGSAAEAPAPQGGASANACSKEEDAAAQESRTDKSDR